MRYGSLVVNIPRVTAGRHHQQLKPTSLFLLVWQLIAYLCRPCWDQVQGHTLGACPNTELCSSLSCIWWLSAPKASRSNLQEHWVICRRHSWPSLGAAFTWCLLKGKNGIGQEENSLEVRSDQHEHFHILFPLDQWGCQQCPCAVCRVGRFILQNVSHGTSPFKGSLRAELWGPIVPCAFSARHDTLSSSSKYFDVGFKEPRNKKEKRSIKQNKQKFLGMLTLSCFSGSLSTYYVSQRTGHL